MVASRSSRPRKGRLARSQARARPMSRERAVAIAPGLMDTAMLDGLPASVKGELGKTVPFPSRLGEAAEFARLVRHVVENAYLNGETIRLDGAIRLGPK